jgi:hypothetical protein
MKPLLSSLNALEIHHLKNVLEAEGIRCWIRNELLSRLAGEIPFTECAMELHLVRAEDRRARSAARGLAPSAAAGAAACPSCGERIEGQFGACWNCGAARPDR